MTTTTTATRLLRDDGRPSPMFGFLNAHRAFRRDVARFRSTADRWHSDAPTAEQLEAFTWHWGRYDEALHFHHTMEDERLFVVAGEARPDLGPLIAELAQQHEALDELLPRLRATLTAEGLARGDAAGALAELQNLLEPHLAAEEEHLVPVILETVEQHGPPQGPPPDEEAPVLALRPSFAVPWAGDELEPEVHAAATAQLPEPLRSSAPDLERAYAERLTLWWQPEG
jgi:hemerythrin-like domain-containing protein